MDRLPFETTFTTLTGKPPFPWQRALYERFAAGDIPVSCNLPTGLGKTSVIAVWLIAFANGHSVPRRLVYVVNRRTVVDQTTDEVMKYRRNLGSAGIPEPLAISTLRGQFADNREWSADPSRPAVICGTVDMIGSRLLFSGYGCGFKTRPLHAGFLGQDSLLIHDEAHLEPAFQKLVTDIQKEQHRCNDFRPMRVMELTATSRSDETDVFGLTDADRDHAIVQQRIHSKKAITLQPTEDEKKIADEIAELALAHQESGLAILVFVRKVDDVEKIVARLKKQQVQQLTGTLRGLERDDLAQDPIFARFLPQSNRPEGVTPAVGTVYLVCTSAGEVGVNISADHLVCDLSTFESMAQRFGRVNRFGERIDTTIHIIHPSTFETTDKPIEAARERTLVLLRKLPITEAEKLDGSPAALGQLDAKERQSAFAPTPTLLPTSDILFDAWALTTIRDRLPGRPNVEPYLHDSAGWQPPETHVAWRQEVEVLQPKFKTEDDKKQHGPSVRQRLAKQAEDLLEAYPLKPHELLHDRTERVFKHLATIAARHPEKYAWLVDDDARVEVFTLTELADKDEKERLNGRTVLLPEQAGGLRDGLLDGSATTTSGLDVADQWFANAEKTQHRRRRLWDDEPAPNDMRRILTIDTRPDTDESADEPTEKRFWHWYELRRGGDDVGIMNSQQPVTWDVHTADVVTHMKDIAKHLPLGDHGPLLVLAAEYHDLGKKRKHFQRVLGNSDYPLMILAKSGKKGGRIEERYRHEFGSLLDCEASAEFQRLSPDEQWFVLHLIATHHGRGRPHFPADEAYDPEPQGRDVERMARDIPRRFARLQQKYGRWGLAYLESLLRAADYAASASPSSFAKEEKS